jgi:hypothetical protein
MTYKCALRCPHCFVFGSPRAKGTFDLAQIRSVLEQARQVESLQWIYFEGGEPFLRFSLLLQAIQRARSQGFNVGVITNGYFARTEETAVHYLEPLIKLGVADLTVSNDAYHYQAPGETPAQKTLKAATRLGLHTTSWELPTLPPNASPQTSWMDAQVQDGMGIQTRPRLKFCGRAAENLIDGLPVAHWETFKVCPTAELGEPRRLSIDAFGNCQLCHGISIGNVWETPLAVLIDGYQAGQHPVCGPIVQGGPALLARTYSVVHQDNYVDACHCCYDLRRALVDRFPTYLAPRQVYGF